MPCASIRRRRSVDVRLVLHVLAGKNGYLVRDELAQGLAGNFIVDGNHQGLQG